MAEVLGYLMTHNEQHIPEVADISYQPDAKSRRDAALLALGYDESVTSIPASLLPYILDQEQNFLYVKVANRVEEQITKALDLQQQIAMLEAQLCGRRVDVTLHMSEEDIEEEPWSYVEWATYEEKDGAKPRRDLEDFYADDWRTLIVLTKAEKRLAADIARQEHRLGVLKSELTKLKVVGGGGLSTEIIVESQEGVA